MGARLNVRTEEEGLKSALRPERCLMNGGWLQLCFGKLTYQDCSCESMKACVVFDDIALKSV